MKAGGSGRDIMFAMVWRDLGTAVARSVFNYKQNAQHSYPAVFQNTVVDNVPKTSSTNATSVQNPPPPSPKENFFMFSL